MSAETSPGQERSSEQTSPSVPEIYMALGALCSLPGKLGEDLEAEIERSRDENHDPSLDRLSPELQDLARSFAVYLRSKIDRMITGSRLQVSPDPKIKVLGKREFDVNPRLRA